MPNKKSKKFDKAEWQRQWRKKNPERYKAISKKCRLKNLYNLSVEDYDQMFVSQNSKCAICGIAQDDLNHLLCVDHNHKTGKIRQLVCRRCNLLIDVFEHGFYGFKDKIEQYLEKNNG